MGSTAASSLVPWSSIPTPTPCKTGPELRVRGLCRVGLDNEFEDEWGAARDWNEDDVGAVMSERVVLHAFEARGKDRLKGKGMKREM